jgi:hypothetical protein
LRNAWTLLGVRSPPAPESRVLFRTTWTVVPWKLPNALKRLPPMTRAFASTPSVGESKKRSVSPVGGTRSCSKKKYVQTVVLLMMPFEAASLTAMRIRLLANDAPKFETVTIQRPERRS